MNKFDPEEERQLRAQFEREIAEGGRRANAAQAAAAHAFARLLNLAETRGSGQITRIARFLASTYTGAFPFDLFELRVVDVAISDDMLCCLDALRWGRADLHKLVPAGMERVEGVIELWGLQQHNVEGQQ